MATLLLRLVDQGVVGLDDPLATWLPDLPDADRVTLRMLTNMTAGYPDYVQNPKLDQELYADPFRQWTNQELIEIGLSTPQVFAPGTNWDYSHTNYVILGQALEKIGGKPLDVAPAGASPGADGLAQHRRLDTAAIPEPVLHAFSSERRQALGIARRHALLRGVDLLEPVLDTRQGRGPDDQHRRHGHDGGGGGRGDAAVAGVAPGADRPGLLGFGAPVAGCPNCHTLERAVQLRARRRPPRRVDLAEPPVRRVRRDRRPICPPRRSRWRWRRPIGRGASTSRATTGTRALQDIFEAIGSYSWPRTTCRRASNADRGIASGPARFLRKELAIQLRDTQTVAVLVTHDATDALAFAGRLLVLVDGRVARSHRTDVVLEQWDHRHNEGGCRRASG